MARHIWRSSRLKSLSCGRSHVRCERSRALSTCRVRAQDPNQDGPRSTSFGFESIPESEKADRVGKVFTSVAPSYDTMNDLMSLGIHRVWKDYFVRSLDPGDSQSPQKILDVAGGTGDIALRLLDHATHINHDTKSTVLISDINADMLAEGRKRIAQHVPQYYYPDSSSSSSSPSSDSNTSRIDFLTADAHTFPTLSTGTFDLYTVAFGIRNFTSIPTALRTAHRLLKPGGVFACLEFTGGPLSNPLLNGIYKRWSFGAIPMIGQLVARDRDSYQYLVESIDRFPNQETFAGMIQEAGFELPGGAGEDKGKAWVDLTGGIAAVHKGIKPIS